MPNILASVSLLALALAPSIARADSTLMGLPTAATPSGSEYVYSIQGGADRKMSVSQIQAFIAANLANTLLVGTFPSGFTRSLSIRLADEVDAADYGMRCDGTPAVDAAGLQAAINTGKNVYVPRLGGNCVLDNANITMSTPGQHLRGDGRHATKFVIAANGTGNGTIVFATGRSPFGPIVDDIGFYFIQPVNLSSPSAATHYPAAINANGGNRWAAHRIGIYGAYIGLQDFNAGDGFDVDDIEISAWSYGMTIDLQTDTVRINNYRWWPYTSDPTDAAVQSILGAGQIAAWFSQGSDRAIGIDIAHCDDCKISNSLFIGGLGLNIHAAADTSYPFGSIINTQLDSYSGMLMTAGNFSMVGGGVSVGDSYGSANTRGVTINGGRMSFSGVQWNYYVPATNATQNTNPLMLVQNAGTEVTVSNNYIELGTLDRSAFQNGGGDVIYTGNYFHHAAGAYTNPAINQGSGNLTAFGNRMAAVGSGIMFGVYADGGNHRIIGNASSGYTLTCPNGASVAVSAGCSTANGGSAASVYLGN